MSKIRKWKMSDLKKLLQEREYGIVTSREICKKLKLKPSSLYTYSSRWRKELKIGRKLASPSTRLKLPIRTEEEIKKGEGKALDWINKGMKQQKFPPEGDPLKLKEQSQSKNLSGAVRVEYDHLSEESTAIRDKTVYADEEVKEKGQRYNPHWDCFVDEDLEKKIPE